METTNSLNAALKDKIRLDLIFRTISRCRKKYILPLTLTAVISSAIMLCIPRYYQVQVMLAPEYSNGGGNMGSLGSVASMFGVNLGNMNSSDAITPMFYPDLMNSTDFLVPLMDVQVETADGSFKGRYVDFLTKKQEVPFWLWAMAKVKSWFKDPGKLNDAKGYKPNPFRLSEAEDKVVQGIASSISCSVDKKTDVISITTTAQDPLVAAQLADTVKQRLQDFITVYRTKKARNDMEHVTKLCTEAHLDYKKKCNEYAQFCDAHQNVTMQSYRTQQDQLENEVQMAYTAYSSLAQQKIMAESKLRERIPAFTTLQNASVPVKHAGPKRMFTVAALLVLAFFVCTIVFMFREKVPEGEGKQ